MTNAEELIIEGQEKQINRLTAENKRLREALNSVLDKTLCSGLQGGLVDDIESICKQALSAGGTTNDNG